MVCLREEAGDSFQADCSRLQRYFLRKGERTNASVSLREKENLCIGGGLLVWLCFFDRAAVLFLSGREEDYASTEDFSKVFGVTSAFLRFYCLDKVWWEFDVCRLFLKLMW